MSVSLPTYDELLDLLRQLRNQVETLQAENTTLRAQLEQAQRAGKRQAAPFRKGPPKPNPQTPGRKAGENHGRHGHRPPPPPHQIDETLEAALPDACPGCGGHLVETEIAH